MNYKTKNYQSDKVTIDFVVTSDKDGLRLDQYLIEEFPGLSRQKIKKKIIAGEVIIENRPCPHRPSVKVHLGEKIKLITFKNDMEDEIWEDELLENIGSPEVIYENHDLLVVSKPAFMNTHPSGKHLFNCATVYFENLKNIKLKSVHRLDRETSGILILAKSVSAAQMVGQLFEDRKVFKCYFFIAHMRAGNQFPIIANERLGSIEGFVPRTYVHCFDSTSKEGKSASTKIISLMSSEKYCIGLAFPLTGRQHQIRAHAAFHGLPLIGDKLYCDDPMTFIRFKDQVATKEDHEKMMIPRHALHACAIYLPDLPYDQKIYIAPIPDDLKKWISDFTDFSIPNLEKLIKENVEQYFLSHLV